MLAALHDYPIWMLDFIDPDPTQALLKIALGVGLIVLGVGLRFQLQLRSRRHGVDAKLVELAEADAALRAAIGVRPTRELELEQRAAAGSSS